MPRFALLLLGIAFTASAGEVVRADIRFVGRAYHYEFAVDVAAPRDAVVAVVTDYDNLKRINDDVIQSAILERYDAAHLKRHLWINHCVLVFCFDLVFVETVEVRTDGAIVTTVLPAESNFLRGVSVWRVESVEDGVTRVSVTAEQEPAFWIPPVIGPLLLKRTFMREIRTTALNIEREARRDGVR